MYVDAASIGDHDDLLELGMDSIRIMDLVETLRADGLEASFEALASASTVHEWAKALSPQAAVDTAEPTAPALTAPELTALELTAAGVGA